MMSWVRFLAVAVLFLSGLKSLEGSEVIRNLKNIALGKTYTWSSTPNYYGCSNDINLKQLTDGVYAKSNKCFWLDKDTVGWLAPASVTIDLGKDMPINGASYSTAGGRSHVMFPMLIFMLVSTDGTSFYLAGDLVEKSDKQAPAFDDESGEKRFIYSSDNIKTHGRYVRFLPWVISPYPYAFIDELEIYEGSNELLKLPYKGKPLLGKDVPEEEIIRASAKIRFVKDIQAIKQELNHREIPEKVRKDVVAELEALSRQVRENNMNFDAATFRAIVPFNSLHQKILAQHGKILAAEGYQALTVWPAYRYSQLQLLDKPTNLKPVLEVKMMQNEYRAEVFNLTNAGTEPRKVCFALKGIPDCVEIRQIECVDSADFKMEAIALADVSCKNGQYETTIHAGMTRQIWMTFRPGTDISGTYKGSIVITMDKFMETVPLTLSVNGFQLPDKSALDVAVWDYAINLTSGITSATQAVVIKDMQAHYVNVACGYRAQAAMPQVDDVDANGHLIKPLDFTPFEQWRKIWPAERYLIYVPVSASSTFVGLKPGTPAFNTAIKEWGEAWDRHLTSVNAKPKTVMINFFDEPRKPQDFVILKQWVTPFKAGSKTVDVYCNPNHLDQTGDMKFAPSVLSSCDVICPMPREYVKYNREVTDYFRKLAQDGKTLAFYSCDGPNHGYDPAYFRFQPWYCFKYGMKAQQFWSYSDVGNSWNQYVRPGVLRCSMVYLDKDSTTTTKHWEAFREGIEDYAYLRILEDALRKASPAQLKKISLLSAKTGDTNAIIHNIVNKVVINENFYGKGRENFGWYKQSPCWTADTQRLLMLELLKILDNRE